MKRLLYIAILLSTLLCGCHGNNGIFEYLLTEFSNLFIKGHSIEMDGLEGCDTVPLPGDKEQIAASFLANIDTLWVQMKDSLAKHPDANVGEYIDKEKFLYDPEKVYNMLYFYLRDYYENSTVADRIVFLPERPSDFYHAWTNLIVYSKDKLLCWAFVVIRQDMDKEVQRNYRGYNVIGKRKSVNEPFKIYVRGRSEYAFSSKGLYIIELMENETLYIPGLTYEVNDVYPIKDEHKLPVLSDPDFFEKHPLFHKFNDSTYNFEWFMRQEYGFYRKRYPEMYRYPY